MKHFKQILPVCIKHDEEGNELEWEDREVHHLEAWKGKHKAATIWHINLEAAPNRQLQVAMLRHGRQFLRDFMATTPVPEGC